MAGDSEQTLQNQQPNGGEPFLIGVSGGTASGKVGGCALLSPGAGVAPVGSGRGPCQLLQPPRGPRASLLAALQRRLQRGLGCGGVAGRYRVVEDSGCRPPRRFFFPGRLTRGPGPVGEGRRRRRMLIVLQVRSLLGRGLGVGSPTSPQCIPFLAPRGRAPSRSARCRRRSDRDPTRGCERTGRVPGREPRSGRDCRALRVKSREPQRCGGFSEMGIDGLPWMGAEETWPASTGKFIGATLSDACGERAGTLGEGPPAGAVSTGARFLCDTREEDQGNAFPWPRAASAGGEGASSQMFLSYAPDCLRGGYCSPPVPPPPSNLVQSKARPGVGQRCPRRGELGAAGAMRSHHAPFVREPLAAAPPFWFHVSPPGRGCVGARGQTRPLAWGLPSR